VAVVARWRGWRWRWPRCCLFLLEARHLAQQLALAQLWQFRSSAQVHVNIAAAPGGGGSGVEVPIFTSALAALPPVEARRYTLALANGF
jgi:hypothetical protein